MMFIHPLFLGKIGLTEILVILLIVVIFFGGKKIPELMRGMGRGVREFKDAMENPAAGDEKNGKEQAAPLPSTSTRSGPIWCAVCWRYWRWPWPHSSAKGC